MRAFWTQAIGLAEQAGDEERPSAHLSTQHGVPETPTRTGLTFPLPHHLFISMGPPAEPQSFSLPSFFLPSFLDGESGEPLGRWFSVERNLPSDSGHDGWEASAMERYGQLYWTRGKRTDEWTPNAFTPKLSEVFNFPQLSASIRAGPF